MDFLTQVSTPLNFNGNLGPPREPYNLQDKKYPIMLIWVRKYLLREKVQRIYAPLKGTVKQIFKALIRGTSHTQPKEFLS